jgi:Fe-S-cluster-containing hydrogenase component 2
MIRCDIEKCSGCRMCEVACSMRHFGAVSPSLSRIRVAKLEESGIDLAIACIGCEEKPCLECAVEGLEVGKRGEIVLDEEACIRCEECMPRCPIGAIGSHDGLPLFCNLCDGKPECVEICPTQALSVIDESPSLGDYLEQEEASSVRRARYAWEEGVSMRAAWADGKRLGP